MSVALAPSKIVPAEFRGKARQFRDRIAQEDDAARLFVAAQTAPLVARIKRRSLTPRPEILHGISDAWQRKMPRCGRLALEIDLDRRKKTLRISETRLSASAYQDRLWDSSEIGLIVLTVKLDTGPSRYELITTTLAHVSLHALARRLQRGLDVGDGAIRRDFLELAQAHPGLAEVENGTDVMVPVPNGSWRANVAAMDDSRGRVNIALAVRTFLGDDA